MGQEADNTILYKDETPLSFLETLILAANNKFFKGNYRLDSDDFILYNAIIRYFKGNS